MARDHVARGRRSDARSQIARRRYMAAPGSDSVFLDANILASCATEDGEIRHWWLESHDYSLVTSPEVISEALFALASKRFGSLQPEVLRTWLLEVCERCSVFRRGDYRVLMELPATVPTEDRHVVEAAANADCDVLLTGDARLVAVEVVGTMSILRFREFVDAR